MKLERTDWLSFGATTVLAFTIYFLTLTPEVGLTNSGYFSVAAMYDGVPMPAGFPLWTLWAWVFTKALLFSNIDRRVAMAAAVAAAFACGVIALTVSQMGASILERQRGHSGLTPNEEKWLRAVCGYTAGMVFGLNGGFWPSAVMADPFCFNILLLCLVLWLVLRWGREPSSKRCLYAAAFIYGALLAESQIELALAPAIPFLVALHDRKTGRDLLLTASLVFLAGIVLNFMGDFPILPLGGGFFFYLSLGALTCLAALGLTIQTRRAFTEWRAVLLCCGATLLGLSGCFYIPLAAMTNPPANWSYARTVVGFFHNVIRGQYDKINMTASVPRFLDALAQYFSIAAKEFGWPYLIIAAIPVLFLRSLGAPERRCVFGLLILYAFPAILVLAVLSPTRDRQMQNLLVPYLSISYTVLAVLMGCGLILLGPWMMKCFRRT